MAELDDEYFSDRRLDVTHEQAIEAYDEAIDETVSALRSYLNLGDNLSDVADDVCNLWYTKGSVRASDMNRLQRLVDQWDEARKYDKF